MSSRVAVVIPFRNEAAHLPATLRGLEEQTFQRERLYVIGVDGASTDASGRIFTEWLARTNIAGALVKNPAQRIPSALNLGVRNASPADVIVRLDARTICGPTYLDELVGALENAPDDVACVGGAQIPEPATTFEGRVVQSLYTNPIGLGAPDFRTGEGARFVDSAYLGAWRPGVIQAAGGFDEAMIANEDSELSARVRAQGWRIQRIDLPCRYVIKRGIVGTIQQWSSYGFWRGKTLRRHPEAIRARHVAAPGAWLAVLLLAASPARALLLAGCAAYAVLVVRGRSKNEPWQVTCASALFFAAVQFGYSCGLVAGLATGPLGFQPAAF